MNWSIKLRVVVDTNVFISGLLWGGRSGLIIQKWRQNAFFLLISPFLLGEITVVLERLQATQYQINIVLKEIEANSSRIIPPKKASVCRDEKDNQILDLCLAGKAHYLVTGDKDLLVLKEFQGTEIVKLKEFLQLVQ